MAEFTAGRSVTDKFILDQFTVGFNSRGMSVAYLRNRFEGTPSTTILRVATGFPVSRGAVGVGVSLYGAPGENARGLDLGLLYGVGRVFTVGGTARYIGRPTVGGEQIPIVLNGGGLLSLAGGTLQIAGEVAGTERLAANAGGWDMTYRAGTTFRLGLARPIDLIGVADLGSNLRIDRLHFGIAVGGRSQVGVLATTHRENGTPRIDRLSVVGVASDLFLAR